MQTNDAQNYKKKFRQLIENIRIQKGWSHDKIGKILNVSAAAYGKWVKVNLNDDTSIPRDFLRLGNLLKYGVSQSEVKMLQEVVMNYRGYTPSRSDVEKSHPDIEDNAVITLPNIQFEVEEQLDVLANVASALAKYNSARGVVEALEGAVKLVRQSPLDGGSLFVTRMRHLAFMLESINDFCLRYIDPLPQINEVIVDLQKFRALNINADSVLTYINNDIADDPSEFHETSRLRHVVSDILHKLAGTPKKLVEVLERLDNLLGFPRIIPVHFQIIQTEIEESSRELEARNLLEDVRSSLCVIISRHLDVAADLTIFREQFSNGMLGPEMVIIPACINGFPQAELNKTISEWRITPIQNRFAIGRFAITFSEYDLFCEATEKRLLDDLGWGRGRYPAIGVTWEDALEFLAWLNGSSGCYRMPTVSEWEYACRGDSSGKQRTEYSLSIARKYRGIKLNPGDANCLFNVSERASGKTAEVDSHAYPQNEFLLAQMHGNVWEFCAPDGDAYFASDFYYNKKTKNRFPQTKLQPMQFLRGGSWGSAPEAASLTQILRTPIHQHIVDRHIEFTVGFRIARHL